MNMAKITKRSFLAVTLILLAAAGAFANGSADSVSSGVVGTEATAVDAFTDVYVEGIANLSVRQGAASSVTFKGDSGLIDSVSVTSVDGYLSILAEGNDTLDLSVEIVTPDLAALMLDNGTKATIGAWNMDSDLSIVLSDDSSLDTQGVLTARNVTIYGQRALGGTMNLVSDTVSVRINDGTVSLSGDVDRVSAFVSLDGSLVLDNLAVQNVDAILYNDGSLDAQLPGISIVEVATNQDATATFEMNGTFKASALGDSSISASGNIVKAGIYEGADASISVN